MLVEETMKNRKFNHLEEQLIRVTFMVNMKDRNIHRKILWETVAAERAVKLDKKFGNGHLQSQNNRAYAQ